MQYVAIKGLTVAAAAVVVLLTETFLLPMTPGTHRH